MKNLKIILFVLLFIYISANVYLYTSQKAMIYFPDKTDFYSCDNFEKSESKDYKGTRFYEKKWNNNLIVYFHWNEWSACDRTTIKWLLEETKSTYIFLEYSGYWDLDNNKPNIEDILIDIDNLWEYINTKQFDKVSVLWRSLWTWTASYFASINEIDKLLLISPYSQLYKIWADQYPIFPVKYLFTENYNPISDLEKYNADILVIHWKLDKVIPFKYWNELFESLNTNNKEFFVLEDWTHHNIFDYDDVNERIVNYFE